MHKHGEGEGGAGLRVWSGQGKGVCMWVQTSAYRYPSALTCTCTRDHACSVLAGSPACCAYTLSLYMAMTHTASSQPAGKTSGTHHTRGGVRNCDRKDYNDLQDSHSTLQLTYKSLQQDVREFHLPATATLTHAPSQPSSASLHDSPGDESASDDSPRDENDDADSIQGLDPLGMRARSRGGLEKRVSPVAGEVHVL